MPNYTARLKHPHRMRNTHVLYPLENPLRRENTDRSKAPGRYLGRGADLASESDPQGEDRTDIRAKKKEYKDTWFKALRLTDIWLSSCVARRCCGFPIAEPVPECGWPVPSL